MAEADRFRKNLSHSDVKILKDYFNALTSVDIVSVLPVLKIKNDWINILFTKGFLFHFF